MNDVSKITMLNFHSDVKCSCPHRMIADTRGLATQIMLYFNDGIICHICKNTGKDFARAQWLYYQLVEPLEHMKEFEYEKALEKLKTSKKCFDELKFEK